MTDAQQVSPKAPAPVVSPARGPESAISVTARDPDDLRGLLRSRSYTEVATAVGVSKTYIGELGVGHRTRVSLTVAKALESALGREPGGLFRIDPAAAHAAKPYLK